MNVNDDLSAFTQHFVRSQRRVYGYILTLAPNPNEADDLFQETSLLLWKHAAEFDPTRDFTKWACGIAFNVVRNYRAKQGRDRHLFSEAFVAQLADLRETQSSWLGQHSEALSGCLQHLSEKDQNLLQDVYRRGRTLPEIASELEIRVNTLYQRMHRIRQQLLECVKRRVAKESG